LLAIWLVRFFSFIVHKIALMIPKRLRAEINKKYRPRRYAHKENPPAFDLVRASVNLTIASMLIAIATLNKLPLSTTYVSFMVAMGTSLADLAWGGSAQYRIAGVVNVIGGWLMTAIIAFIVAGIFAGLIYKFEMAGVLFLLIVLSIVIYILNRRHQKQLRTSTNAKLPGLSGI
jgi:phosphate/sulfate permease